MPASDTHDPIIVLYDDALAERWLPLTSARPAGELLFGAVTARRRAELLFGGTVAGHFARPELVGFEAPGAAPVIGPSEVPNTRVRLFLNSRAILDWRSVIEPGAGPARLLVDGDVAGAWLPAGDVTDPLALIRSANSAAAIANTDPAAADPRDLELGGRFLEHVWDLVSDNPAQTARDIAFLGAGPDAPAPVTLPDDIHVIGSTDDVWVHRTADIEPGVVLDTRDGPIWLEEGVTVRAFTRLAGPAFVGRGTTLLGGRITAVSIGPVCKVHGELEESVILGYSNKAHDGFIGHAYLGEWVNLGALTTNSDLKNNYGSIRVWTPNGAQDTGRTKLGSLLGDHVKTGIGVMLNTGTVIGLGSSVFGATQPPKYVPPFSWGTGDRLGTYDVEKFLDTARTVMSRRQVALGDGACDVLRRAWQASAAQREERPGE